MSIWKQHPELMKRLGEAQNHPACINSDIMTWAGLCESREELERHVLSNERRVAEFQPKKTKRRVGA